MYNFNIHFLSTFVAKSKMAKRPFFEFILQVINLVFLVWGLGTLGYGLACFFKWKQTLPNGSHRLLLAQQSQETLPKALYVCLPYNIF